MNSKQEKIIRLQVYAGVICIFIIYLIALHFSAVAAKQESLSEAANPQDKKVAITFDDGPSPEYTAKLLDGLKERNVKATFFVIGNLAEEYPDVVKRMYEEGHEIGNHTYDHVNLCCLSKEEIKEQVKKTNEVIEEITGECPIYIRPPYGLWSKELSDETGMIEVLWDVDPRDWETTDAGTVIQRVLSNVEDHEIILFHDCSKSSVDAALAVVDALVAEGYEFVSVEEILFD